MEQTGKKEKDFALFEYDPNHEKAVKITFSGNIKLKNGYKGTILELKENLKMEILNLLKSLVKQGFYSWVMIPNLQEILPGLK